MWVDSQGTVTAGSLHLKGPIPSGQGGVALIEGELTVNNASIGIFAASTSSTGIIGSSGNSNNSGVQGVNTSGGGVGVLGGASGSGIAVRGDNTDGSGWAGFFNGRAFTTAGVWSASDIRLKKDVKNLPYGLNDVLRMRPVTYFWKNDTEARNKQLGLIAQEVQKIIPEAVTLDKTTDTYSINYPTLVPVLIKAVQDLQITVKGQERRIALLESGTPSQTTSILSPVTLGSSAILVPFGLLMASRFRGRRLRHKDTGTKS